MKKYYFLFLFSIILLSGCTKQDNLHQQNKGGANPKSALEVLFDMGECDKIKAPNIKNDCYIKQAIAKKDVQICEKINNKFSPNKSECYEDLAISENNIDICNKITDSDLTKLKCRVSINKDIKLCDESEGFKNSCLIKLAMATKDISICKQINHKPRYSLCLSSVAESAKSKDFCDIIDDLHMKELCFIRVAIETKNPKMCNEISFEENKQICFFGLAIETFDIDLCDDSGIKKRCKDIINNK
ncbi:hypothetical protein HOD96_02185 [Candidatus Falkowbacteria bacterium]|jgi:hypothetical protein|nr:hypothetical protein [Candidatus Falkowbacteria bacterium]MBT4433100.1 hypothetical protein [Candidatus Falkowbacteria bacterium]